MFDNEYISLEKVAAQLNLPQRYIRELSNNGKIPHLIVGGRLRFNSEAVRQALDELAAVNGGGNDGKQHA